MNNYLFSKNEFFFIKFEIIYFFIVYYNIVIWASGINQSVVCDNYNDFQHVNFIFSQNFISGARVNPKPHDCTAPVGRSVQKMGHVSSSSSWNCVNQHWTTVKPFRLLTFDLFCSRYFPNLTLPSHLTTLLTTLLGLGTRISKRPWSPCFYPRFVPQTRSKGQKVAHPFLAHLAVSAAASLLRGKY
jgi:hypothetical protein